MATAQVESATTALHDEKLEEQPIKKTENDQETTVTAPQPQDHEDQLPKEPVDTTGAPEPEVAAPEPEVAAPEPEVAAPEPEAEPKAEPEPELESEAEALAAEVETKVVLKEEEEGKVISVDQTAKVAPEPCVEEEAKETKEPEGKPAETEAITEPTEATKAEVEVEPEEKVEKKEEGDAAE